ncbi:hypothetical protein [Nocardia abscessus]|uniref:hypothetical protein n=1 Tax=Nocardia abscessus TaxID=120957 RepID=UPI002453BB17|nr:hypothetical protein [Nocardia abscessus]
MAVAADAAVYAILYVDGLEASHILCIDRISVSLQVAAIPRAKFEAIEVTALSWFVFLKFYGGRLDFVSLGTNRLMQDTPAHA